MKPSDIIGTSLTLQEAKRSPTVVRKVQVKLKQLKLYDGFIDGIWGDLTEAGYKKFLLILPPAPPVVNPSTPQLPGLMKMSESGLVMLKRFEGIRLNAYDDSTGVWTIGYGHTQGVKPGMVITKQKADELLAVDIRPCEATINHLVKVPITQNQFDALVSLAFNIGVTAIRNSTLIRKLNLGNFAGVADEFVRWNKAKGRVLEGLTKRRVDEAKLFMKDVKPE